MTIADRQLKFIQSITDLYITTSFNVEDKETQQKMTEAFYNLASYLTKKYPLNADVIPYYISNYTREYSTNIKVGTLVELQQFFEREKEQGVFNKNKLTMGFRSIYFILDKNLRSLSQDEMDKINSSLYVFFDYLNSNEMAAQN
jgi:hypothetical protein